MAKFWQSLLTRIRHACVVSCEKTLTGQTAAHGTIAARKLAAYLLAAEKSGRPFVTPESQ